MQILKITLVGAFVCFLTGCKLAVMTVQGGEVQSIASGTCVSGSLCVHEVVDTNFTETFTAVALPGWQFSHWYEGEFFQCAGLQNPVCTVSNAALANEGVVASIIASEKEYYLMPVFELVSGGAPIADTVLANGLEWAQVDLFLGVTKSEIEVVCPAGICSGALNGYNLTGWTWANVADMNSLFNDYIGQNVLGPGPDIYSETSSLWAPSFYSDGWRRTINFGALGIATSGYIEGTEDRAVIGDLASGGLDIANSGTDSEFFTHGAWLYRAP